MNTIKSNLRLANGKPVMFVPIGSSKPPVAKQPGFISKQAPSFSRVIALTLTLGALIAVLLVR